MHVKTGLQKGGIFKFINDDDVKRLRISNSVALVI